MANALVRRLKELEGTEKFVNATPDQQRSVRQKFVTKHLETDPAFVKLQPDQQTKVRDTFLNRDLPARPLSAKRAAEVAAEVVTGADSGVAFNVPIIGAATAAARALDPREPTPRATPEEAAQLDPTLAQLVGTISRVRLGIEKGTLALAGLAPKLQRILSSEFSRQEDLVQAVEDAGGIGVVRSALTGLAGEFVGAAGPIVAGAKALNLAKRGAGFLKEGGASLGLRATGAATVAGGEAVGATRIEPPQGRPLTDVPAIGPVFEALERAGGPSDPETGEPTLRQEAVAFGAGAALGVFAAPLAPGKKAARPITTEPEVTVGVTPEMAQPVAREVEKAAGLPPGKAQPAVIDFITGADMDNVTRQTIADALEASEDISSTPAGQVARAKVAREDGFRPAQIELDILPLPDETIPLPERTSAARRGGRTPGEDVAFIMASPEGVETTPRRFTEGTNQAFVRQQGPEAARSDQQLRNVASEIIADVNSGLMVSRVVGTSERVINKLMTAVDALTEAKIPLPKPGDVAIARRLPDDIRTQMDAVLAPNRIGAVGTGTITRIATMGQAKRVVKDFQDRGFNARAVLTDGQSGNFHVVWNVRDSPAAAAVSETLVKRSQADPTMRDSDGGAAGLNTREQAGVAANRTNTDVAARVLEGPPPPRKPVRPRPTQAEPAIVVPTTALTDIAATGKTAGITLKSGPNVIDIADRQGRSLRKVEFGPNRIIKTPSEAMNVTRSTVEQIKSGAITPRTLAAHAILSRTLDDMVANAEALGLRDARQAVDGRERLRQARDIVRNLDLTAPTARQTLNDIRGSLVFGDELQNFVRSPDDLTRLEETLGPLEGIMNTLEDVVTTVNDPVTRRSPLTQNRPAPPDIPRVSQTAERAIEARSHGQYAEVRPKEDLRALDRMVSDGSAVTLLRNTADRLSDPSLPKSRHPLQGQKITAEVMNVRPGAKDKVIVIHDVGLKETQRFPYDGRGVADALNYIESGPRRLGCALCDLGLRGPIQVGENRWAVMDDRSAQMAIFSSPIAAMRWARTQMPDPSTGYDVKFPADVPIEAQGNWAQMDFGGARGITNGPLELAPALLDELPPLLRAQQFVDPAKTFMQSVESRFPQFPVFSQIWEPVEAGARVAQQWLTPKHDTLAALARKTGDDQAQGMQVMWMFGRKNKNVAAQVKQWYRMSDADVGKGEQFRQKIIEFGNDHGLDMDDFMQNQMTRIMQHRGLVDQAYPNIIPKEAAFFRAAFREDEVSARALDMRDTAFRLTRMMAQEAFLRPAILNAEAIMQTGLGEVKGLAGPVRQYLDAKVARPPESRDFLDKTMEALWRGGVESVQKNVVRRIGLTTADKAMSRHLETVDVRQVMRSVTDWWLGNVYGALMAWRPGVVIRNMSQTMLTIVPRTGTQAWQLGMRDAVREGGFDAPRKAGAVDDVVPLPFSQEITESVNRQRFGKSKLGKLFVATDTFTRLGLVPFTGVDRFHRATAYHAMKHLVEATTKAFPDVWAQTRAGQVIDARLRSRLDQVSEAIGIDMFGPIVKRQAREMLDAGRLDDLIPYLGRNLAEDTQWVYRSGNQAGLFRGTAGKIFGNFSTWPTWFARYAINTFKNGTPRNKAKAIAAFVAVNEGLMLTGREVFGIDASHWLYWHPLNYGGGTNTEALIALLQAEFLETLNNQDSFAHRRARRKLETYWQRQVPGFGAGKDAYNFFSANSAKEAVRKATGFPEAGPGSLSVGERALSSLGVDVGQAQKTRSDVELVPLP